MSLTLTDALHTARNLASSMRQRDAAMESARRSARVVLNRLESSLEANDKKAKTADDQDLVEPFPDFIMKSPEHRQLYDSNRALCHVVAEQQITLHMIMEKYREKMMEMPSATSYLRIQKLIERYESQIGVLMHEKGVALQVLGGAVWEEDEADFGLMQYSTQILTENETLRHLVQHSLRTNGQSALSSRPDMGEMEGSETEPAPVSR